MKEIIILNLMNIGIAFGLFALCVAANIIVSIFKNIKQFNEQWDRDRFFEGLLKMLSVGVSTAILSLVVTIIPYVPILSELFSSEGQEIFGQAAIILLYANAIRNYFTKAYNNNKLVLETFSELEKKVE